MATMTTMQAPDGSDSRAQSSPPPPPSPPRRPQPPPPVSTSAQLLEPPSRFDSPDRLSGSMRELHAERRARVAGELVASEAGYFCRLAELKRDFYDPWQGCLPRAEHAAVFSCLESILACHTHLNASFLAAAKLHPPESSANGGLRTAAVIAAFAEILPYLKMYSTYISNFETALAAVGRVARNDGDAANSSPGTPAPMGGLAVQLRRLEQLLIEPVQRIPRYKLLLQALSRHTPRNHPAAPQLADCLERISVLADDINEQPRQHEQRCRLLELHHSLGCVDFARHFTQLDGFSLASAHRRVLRVCQVQELDSLTQMCDPALLVLCTDLLLKCRPVGGKYIPGCSQLSFDGLIWLYSCCHAVGGVLSVTPTPYPKNIASCVIAARGVSAVTVPVCGRMPDRAANERRRLQPQHKDSEWHLWFDSETTLASWSHAIHVQTNQIRAAGQCSPLRRAVSAPSSAPVMDNEHWSANMPAFVHEGQTAMCGSMDSLNSQNLNLGHSRAERISNSAISLPSAISCGAHSDSPHLCIPIDVAWPNITATTTSWSDRICASEQPSSWVEPGSARAVTIRFTDSRRARTDATALRRLLERDAEENGEAERDGAEEHHKNCCLPVRVLWGIQWHPSTLCSGESEAAEVTFVPQAAEGERDGRRVSLPLCAAREQCACCAYLTVC